GGARSRPSETVTRFPLSPDNALAPAAQAAASPSASEPLLPPRPPRRVRSADDVLIWGDPGEEAAGAEAPATFERASLGARFLSALLDLVFAAGIAFICFVPAIVAIVTHSSLKSAAGSSVTFWGLVG